MVSCSVEIKSFLMTDFHKACLLRARDKKAEMKITCIFFALHPENIHLILL